MEALFRHGSCPNMVPCIPPQHPLVLMKFMAFEIPAIDVRRSWVLRSSIALIVFLAPPSQGQETIQFNRDVLPILADHCFSCHGPDESKVEAGLRLDSRARLLDAISLDNPEESELLRRVASSDPELQMPPPKSHKKTLTPSQVSTLRQWIKTGAPWGKHWTFEKPTKPPLPSNQYSHPIDALIAARLERRGFHFSARAEPYTLARRLSFDLTGLPPSSAWTDKRSADWNVDSYIDQLLQSEHYGERMAMWWLDVSRYSDTDGFQQDATRTNWPWRDWVVDAFNSNKSFRQFTREQFAGDLLPDATPEQKLATCFHRNHMTNGEGGRDPEESRVDYVIDRVNTMGTVWLGLTLGCCQCHSHKFDPISQTDYYSLSAFFNSIDESGKAGGDAKPYLTYQSSKAERVLSTARQLLNDRKPIEQRARDEARQPFQSWLSMQRESFRHGDFKTWHALEATELSSSEGTQLQQETEDRLIRATGPNPNQDDYRICSVPKLSRLAGFKLEVFPDERNSHGKLSRGATGEFVLTDVKAQVRQIGSSQVRDLSIVSAIADFSADKKSNDNYGDIKDTLDDDPRNGWTTKGAPNDTPHTAVFGFAEPLILANDEEVVIELRHRSTLGDANLACFRLSWTDQRGEAIAKLDIPPLEQWAAMPPEFELETQPSLRERLFEQFLLDYEPYQAPRELLDRAKRQLAELEKAAQSQKVMVLEERQEPRPTFVLVRGVWDKHGDRVTHGVPTAVLPWSERFEPSRLGLADWITSDENPLTARVFVNHLWQLFFGQGLVRTQEDFGVQGDVPEYPEVLDWLAVDFVEHGWDVKRLIRQIVSSHTYQQTSITSNEMLTLDPDNRWLARGARFRIPSWMLRDSALAIAGLMDTTLGGPPMRPYQPEGVWEELFMGRFKYEPSEGPLQYRRTLYTFWRRSIAPPFLFDTAQRRSCEVRVGRTNTPLHALVLLNDETFLECSLALAMAASRNHEDAPEQLRSMFSAILIRKPTDHEQLVLQSQYQRAIDIYEKSPELAKSYLQREQVSVPRNLSAVQIASLAAVASMIFNLDEAMTHE